MSEEPAHPEAVLNQAQLERFVQSCSRERRTPMTHKTMDAISYGWLHNFIDAYMENGEGSHIGWPGVGEVDLTALGAFFLRVSARLRDETGRAYAVELADHFTQVGEDAFWPRSI